MRRPKKETPDERERRIRKRLRDDYEHFARKCLKVVPLDPERSVAAQLAYSTSLTPVPFVFNRAQRYLHARAEAMLARVGYVAIIGLKGRKQGFSSYVSGRGVWRSSNTRSYPVRTMAHKVDSTNVIFDMVKAFYENLPALVKPKASNDNAKELKFDALDSGFKVFTAGGEGVGRADTARMFHWSEVAFSPNAESHARGALRIVPPRAKGTEKWLESTTDGPGNLFHRMCMDAIAGRSEYEFVFVPWYWQEEYRADVPDGFTLTSDEAELLAIYGGQQADGGPGMSAENIVWRRLTVAELGSVEAFTREYPNSAEEAFAASAAEKLVNPLLVQAAKLRTVTPADVWPLWGVDPAWKGKDDSTLVKRQGNVLLPSRQIMQGETRAVAAMVWHGLDTMGLAGRIVEEYRATPVYERPSHIIVDVIGIGAGVAHRLREVFEENRWDAPYEANGVSHPGTAICGLNVGESASENERFMRRRDELHWKRREWYEAKDCSIPDDEAFIQEECAATYDRTSGGKLKVEDKEKTKKTLGRSPDRSDGFMHTFHVSPQPRNDTRRQDAANMQRSVALGPAVGGSGGWMSRM